MRHVLAGAAVLVLTAGATTAAVAPGAPAVPASPDPAVSVLDTAGGAPEPAAAPAGAPVEITLITGDTVVYTDTGGPRPDVAVELAPDSGTRGMEMTVGPDGVHVVPDQAKPLISAGLLDERLFDVRYLAENGYTDDRIDTIPLIVTYADGAGRLAQRSAALPATSGVTPLTSIDGAAVDVAKDATGDFWRHLTSRRARSSAAVEKVWLDARVSASLDDSRPQIGVPEAWESGYDGDGVTVAVLDTGYDTGHPDLAGQVVGSRSFIEGETVHDGHGHGTHVASTVAGTGAASDGRYSGVAPGADLLVGKVLDDQGYSYNSEVIDGMEWAVEQGADIVNLSLGSYPSNGQDPQSQALNRLSEESGTLFVVAAGNYGPGAPTVTSPAAADAALAVGAVDAEDRMADFSSRGPRVGDRAIKPEITAPGAAIVAARAGGTEEGVPVGEYYLANGGTSMASPHVAGVAAMVAQRHPDWTGAQLKDALMSTAVDLGHDLYAQGSGRVDAAAVTSSPLTATGKAELGVHPYPQTGAAPRTVPVTYVNSGGTDLRLELALDVTDLNGAAPAAGALTLSAPSLTVPAGGTATVEVTLDPARSAAGRFTGHLRATAPGGAAAITAVAFEVEPATHQLTVGVVGRDGATPDRAGVVVVNEANPALHYSTQDVYDGDELVFRVPAGTYTVYGTIATGDPGGGFTDVSSDIFAQTGVRVGADTRVVADARDAVDIEFDVTDDPRPTEPTQLTTTLYRTMANGATTVYTGLNDRSDRTTRYGAIPAPEPATGELTMTTATTLREPLIRAAAGSATVPVVTPRYTGRFAGERVAPLVDVGAGTAEEYAAADVDGAVVLVSGDPSWAEEQARLAETHGAAALLVARDRPGPVSVSVDSANTLPVLATSFEEGERLRERLADGPVELTLTGVTEGRFTYQLWAEDAGRIPDELTHTTRRAELAAVENTYHAEVEGLRGSEVMEVYAAWEGGTFRFFDQLIQPVRRTDYVTAGRDMRQRQQVHSVWSWNSVNLRGTVQAYQPGRTYPVSWHEAPGHPTAHTDLPCVMCRSENIWAFAPWPRGDSDPTHYGSGRTWTTTTLFRDGERIDDPAAFLVEEEATYRIEQVGQAEVGPEHQLAADTHTAWTFVSEAPAELEIDGCGEILPSANVCAAFPVIMLGYDVPLDLLNRAPAGRGFGFTVRTSRAVGYTGPSDVAGMTVDVSFDDGGTWVPARVLPRPRGGEFQVRTHHPKLADTSGFVSLRVEVWDDRGNRTVQTIERAYALP
ncbi:S8 family peptidase [Jiangella rhizosphaerae]|uniref:S8 family peptidase n=1 Tax=Jiangella rhizosphaerae TaxID=2293569 RepID=UPI00131416E3|nr:S8 family serine peptidase [Jiangella rhizosphaerae]